LTLRLLIHSIRNMRAPVGAGTALPFPRAGARRRPINQEDLIVNFKQVASLAALAIAASGASAAGVEHGSFDFGPHDPTEVGSNSISLPAYSSFDDVFTFTLSGNTTLSEYAL